MASATRTKFKRQQWRDANKEDVAYILEEVWFIAPDETFYKIFSNQAMRGVYSTIELSKADL